MFDKTADTFELTTPLPRVDDTAIDFPQIYRQNVAYVWRVLRRLGVASADLEDVAHEVFMVVQRKLPSYESRGSTRTWVYAISLRCASDYRRRTRRRKTVALDDLNDAGPLIDGRQLEQLENTELRQLLEHLLDSLDSEKREVFVLHELEELPMSDIAEIVRCPLQTAYSRLHAARIHIKAVAARLRKREGA